jgi:hypothetical protein
MTFCVVLTFWAACLRLSIASSSTESSLVAPRSVIASLLRPPTEGGARVPNRALTEE